jgi:hypothetical protein
MTCDACGREVAPGDRFCTGCGIALTEPANEPARTELLPVAGDEWGDEHWGDDDPVWAATGAVATQSTANLPATEPITEVWMAPDAEPAVATPYDFAEREHPVTATTTAQMPVTAVPAPAPSSRFQPVVMVWLGLLTGIVALVGSFATIVSISTSDQIVRTEDTPAAFRTGTWIVDDLADNLSIAALIAVAAIVAGGVAAGFGWRWGSGLAGGAGLALAGLAAIAIGLAQIPIDAAHELARIPTEQRFTLTITRDLGYWLLLVAGALGVVLFFASLNDAGSDRRAGLNPWIAALGALAALVAAVGPMLPEQRAVFSDNWYLIDGPGQVPAMLVAGRLVQLGLLVVAGVIGFLSVRRWGLGIAIGGALPVAWLAVSTLFELTDRPVGPGFRNPGATEVELHGVTIIGVSALLAMAVLAVIAAYDQGVRERP